MTDTERLKKLRHDLSNPLSAMLAEIQLLLLNDAKLDEETFFGPLRFNAQGMNVVKPMSVVQVQDGRPVAVWPKDAAAAKLKWPPRG